MIELTDISFAYPGSAPVISDLSLTIPAGQHIALMGRNGSGKSTLALLIKGLLEPQTGTVRLVESGDNGGTSREELMRRVGIVFQNPDDTIVATTVERELAFGLENAGVPRQEMIGRVEDTLVRFDLDRYRHVNPSHLSGGEKQRLALAAVMIMRPEVLILDEPTSLLDPWSRNGIVDYIHRAACEGATVVHITQFDTEADQADRLLVMDNTGTVTDLRGTHPGISTEHELLIYNKTRTENTGKTGQVILELDAIHYVYESGTPFEHKALNGVGVSLGRGSSTVLLGPTGSGKTTLLEIAAGVTSPTGGTVRCEKNLVRSMAFQFPEDQMFGNTVADYIAFGPVNLGVPERALKEIVDTALSDVGLDPDKFRNRDPFTLSGGEKRRTALAGVLAMKPHVLILDEPFAGLDREGTILVYGFLERYLSGGGTLLFSTHDFDAAQALGDYAVVMKDGMIESSGKTSEVFTSSGLVGAIPFHRHNK